MLDPKGTFTIISGSQKGLVMNINITFTSKALAALPRPQLTVDYTRLGDKELLNLVIQVQRGKVTSESKIQGILAEAEARGLISTQSETQL